MRISVDIPVALYRKVKSKAAREGCSVEEIILRVVQYEVQLPRKKLGRRVSFPLIPSKRPGSLHIDNAKIFELIPVS